MGVGAVWACDISSDRYRATRGRCSAGSEKWIDVQVFGKTGKGGRTTRSDEWREEKGGAAAGPSSSSSSSQSSCDSSGTSHCHAMCWSLEVSLGSYAIVCALSAVLLRRNWQNDRWFALWLLFVGQVQILEAGMWLDQECGWLNQAANAALLAVIGFEPLVHILISLYYTPPELRSPHMKLVTFVAAGNVALFLGLAVPGTTDWCSRPCGADGHLRWPWTDNIMQPLPFAFLLHICAPFAFMRPLSHGVAAAATTAIIFATSFFLWGGATTFESMWCWLAIFGFAVPLLLSRPPPQAVPLIKAAGKAA